MKMFDFAEITNDMSEIEILNYYRNLYYTEPQVTEHGIVANAINGMLDFINRQKAEIERLKSELSNTRRKALLEASSKFAGHSNYHGDTILCKLICMAEGQEVGIAIPLDMSEMKANAYKEFAEKAKKEFLNLQYNAKTDRKTVKIEELKEQMDWLLHTVAIETVENLLKEMVGEEE